MSGAFKLLGVILARYTTHTAYAGAVYARPGAFDRTIQRDETPRYFWVVIVIYAALSVALMTVF